MGLTVTAECGEVEGSELGLSLTDTAEVTLAQPSHGREERYRTRTDGPDGR